MTHLQQSAEATVGASDTVLSIIPLLPRLLPNVGRFTFARYSPSPGVDRRLVDMAGDVGRTAVHRLERQCPEIFESVEGVSAMLLLAHADHRDIFSELSRHDERDESAREFQVAAHQLNENTLGHLVESLEANEVLALSSICVLRNGERGHIPLLDFRLKPSEFASEIVHEATLTLGLNHGAIVASGRSYHLYGFEIYTEETWRAFMARALLLVPMIDVRYVAHRLLARRGVLRITASSSSGIKPTVPWLVKSF